MEYNKKIRILIITDNDFMYSEKSISFRGTIYDIETSKCKISDLANLSDYCEHHLDVIISEKLDLDSIKENNKCLNDSETDNKNAVCKNFFKFHGTFILLNNRYEKLGYSKNYNKLFPYCSCFKELMAPTHGKDKEKTFNKEIKLQLDKILALETNFTYTKFLLVNYLKQQMSTVSFWFQILPYLLLIVLICFTAAGNNLMEKKIMEWFPFNGSHMYHGLAVVRPVSLIMILWTCIMYAILHLPNLFGHINHRNSEKTFSINFALSILLLISAMGLSALKLFDGRIALDSETINTVKSNSFFFTDLMTLICLFLVDLIILSSAYFASKSSFVTKTEEIKLSDISTVYFNTIILCDLPILLGNLFLFLYESKISNADYRFIYSVGTASVSLFVLQLIYFGINIKSTYDKYLAK